MTCPVKHTKCQIPDEDFKCPNCGAGVLNGFWIDESADGSYDNCELLHENDLICCIQCEKTGNRYEWSGKQFAAYYQKKANLVPCPCCKGKGLVKG